MKVRKRIPALAAGLLLLAAFLLPAVNADAMSAVPYDRTQMLAPDAFLSALPRVGDKDTDDDDKPDPKAWQKINGVVYNGSGVAIPGAILGAKICSTQNTRTKSVFRSW